MSHARGVSHVTCHMQEAVSHVTCHMMSHVRECDVSCDMSRARGVESHDMSHDISHVNGYELCT